MTKCDIKKNDDGWEITSARSLNEIEVIRPVWEDMQRNEPSPRLNADIDRYISVLESLRQKTEPHVTVLSRRGEAQAMIVSRLQTTKLECKIGYETVFSPSIRCLSVVHGGIIGNLTDGTARRAVQELRNILLRGDADVIFINHLRVSSPVYPLVRRVSGLLSRGHFLKVESHRRMLLPKTIGQFYNNCSPKHRGTLRRHIRRLERTCKGQVNVIAHYNEDEIDKFISAAARISAQTYQGFLGCGIVDAPQCQALVRAAARSGWLCAHVLFVADEPCAFQIGFHYGRTYFLDQCGFAPSWKHLSVGTVLFMRVLEELCHADTVDYLDFGLGDAEYKQRYGTEQWSETSLYLFAPRLYPIFVNVLSSSVRGASLAIEYCLNRMGLVGYVKRRWRNWLETKRPAKAGQEGR